MQTKEEALAKLSRSAFRSRFHLGAKERLYIAEKGMATVRSHAADFVAQKLAPAYPLHDGKQTPMRGHPVFIAQHACACCCRGCLEKWYKVPRGVALTADQQRRIVDLLMAWIEVELRKPLSSKEEKS